MKILNNDIIYIATPERADNYKFFPEHKQLPNNVQIVSILDFNNISKKYEIDIVGTPIVGTILARNPFDKRKYIEFDKFRQENYIFHKWLTLCEIANHLGAKYVEASFTKSDTQTINWDAEMSLTIKNDNSTEGSINKASDRSNVFNGKVIHRGNSQNKLTQDSYKTAKQIAINTGLIYDRDISYLLEIRNPKCNVSKGFEREMVYESKNESTIRGAIEMSFLPQNIFAFKSSYKQQKMEIKKEEYHIIIDFESDHEKMI